MKLEAPANVPAKRTVTDKEGHKQPIELKAIYIGRCPKASVLPFDNEPTLTQMMRYTTPEVAIYSDDRPIEFWRTIPGFVEAPTATED